MKVFPLANDLHDGTWRVYHTKTIQGSDKREITVWTTVVVSAPSASAAIVEVQAGA